jgi:hypothetical protein
MHENIETHETHETHSGSQVDAPVDAIAPHALAHP